MDQALYDSLKNFRTLDQDFPADLTFEDDSAENRGYGCVGIRPEQNIANDIILDKNLPPGPTVALKHWGENIPVTKDNLEEYIQLKTELRLFKVIEEQVVDVKATPNAVGVINCTNAPNLWSHLRTDSSRTPGHGIP